MRVPQQWLVVGTTGSLGITGAIGLAIGTSLWWLGITVGVVTFVVMFVADSMPDPEREEKQRKPSGPTDNPTGYRKTWRGQKRAIRVRRSQKAPAACLGPAIWRQF
jgi:uncharacterized membrane protein YhiD involved in acid resistance